MIVDSILRDFNDKDARYAIFIRHAEKDSAKNNLEITKRAESECKKLGAFIRSLNRSVDIYSSPEYRCIQTASAISSELVVDSGSIVITSFLGGPGIHVKDNVGYLELFDKFGARGVYDLWVKGELCHSLRSPEELCKELNCFLKCHVNNSEVSLFISQSGTVAALEYALKSRVYDVRNSEWVGFLDGFFLRVED